MATLWSTKRAWVFDLCSVNCQINSQQAYTSNLDAAWQVMLVEHANLNPMGGQSGNESVPRAGCPVVNLRPTLRCLLDAGFSVAVGEERSEGFKAVRSRSKKTRYIAGVVTPASPHYAKGLVDSDTDAELCVPHSPPTVGIVSTAVGYSVIQVRSDLTSS